MLDRADGLLRVVTIDGPAGAGKSTVARGVAADLGFRHLDTGSMYRAVTWAFLERGLEIAEGPATDQALLDLELVVVRPGVVAVDGRELESELHEARVDGAVSPVAAISSVRRAMAGLQREQAQYGPLVAEGRDMGSVVFPDAAWKIYLDASVEERARRRVRDYERLGMARSLEEIRAGLGERDRIDSTRADSPLVCPPGALHIDSDPLSAAEVIERIVEYVRG
jgi:cytidylate kinase